MAKLIAAFTLLMALGGASAMPRTHFIYWNSTNPLFRIDNTDNVVDVNVGNLPSEYDKLHLICPTDSEQHVVYSVSKEEFDSCRVTSPRPKIVAVCDKPGRFMYFTYTFRSFSPTPGGLEFKPGQTYYLISTSNRRDIHRRVGGYCSTHNMKMAFNVADNRATKPVVATDGNSVEFDNGINQVAVDDDAAWWRRRYVPRPTTTTEKPLIWSSGARVPHHRTDYIYYYKPWSGLTSSNYRSPAKTLSSSSTRQRRTKYVTIEELSADRVKALPLTAGSSSLATAFTVPTLVLLVVHMLLGHAL